MSTKVEETSAVDTHIVNMSATTTPLTVSPGGAKVSKFAAKSGFVIPKNKLSGSLVPVFRGGKKSGSNDTTNEENTNKVQRKTKWGPDLTQDATVKKGRALAYQTRVDQITLLLKSGILEVEDNEGSQLADQGGDNKSSNPQVDSERLELLELEKRKAIGEILKLNPSYKTPDYKPVLKEAIVPIPVKQYQGYNFLGLIFGPASDTQKRLEKDTGTMIQVKGTKADTGEKVEISPSDENIQSAYEELYIHISADTYEKVDAAADLIELLVTSVSGNLSALSTTTPVSGEHVNVLSQNLDELTPSMLCSTGIKQGVVAQPLIGSMQTPLQGQFQYQSPSFPSGPAQSPMHPLNPSAPILTSPVSVWLSSENPSNMPSLFGPRPLTAAAFTSTIQNPSLVPQSSHLPMQVPQLPYMPQIHSSSHTGPPRNFSMPGPQPSPGQPNISAQFPFTASQPQPAGPVPIGRHMIPPLPQAVSTIPPVPLPDRPLTPGGSSAGWSGDPVGGAQASLGFSQMAQSVPTMVPPQGQQLALAQPSTASAAPPRNVSASAAGPGFVSGPPQVGSSPAFHTSLRPMQIPFSAPVPIQSSLVPMAASTLPSSSNSRNTMNFSAINPPTTTAPRPQHSSSVDFTFQPHRPQSPVPLTIPRPNSQPANLHTSPARPITQLSVPQAPSFRLAGSNAALQPVMPGFPRAQVGNNMGQSQADRHSSPFARNPNAGFSNTSPVTPATPVSSMGQRNFGPGPQMPNLAGPYPPRPGNHLQQNYPPLPNRPENHMAHSQQFSHKPLMFDKLAPNIRAPQIYDPFSPTSVPIRPQHQGANLASAGKEENDLEYEDLMASVGVK